MQELPKILYKYLPAKRIDFFTAPRLRFTPPDEFNDIFDCQPRTKGLFSPQFFEEQVTASLNKNFDSYVNEALEQATGLPRSIFDKAMTPQMRNHLIKQFGPMFQQFVAQVAPMAAQKKYREAFSQALQNGVKKARVGILCLTPDSANTAMWGLYATGNNGQGNMGFAVGFDTGSKFFDRKLTAEDPLRYLKPVSYVDEVPELYFSDYLDGSRPEKNALTDILFFKDRRWAAEEEWRMVISVPEDSGTGVFGLENVPIGAIKEIFLGAKADSHLEEVASDFCRKHSIPLYRMMPTIDRVLKPEPIIF